MAGRRQPRPARRVNERGGLSERSIKKGYVGTAALGGPSSKSSICCAGRDRQRGQINQTTRERGRRFENRSPALYNFQRNSLPDAPSNPTPAPTSRRWTIFAAGFLLLALALVVIYTSRAAFVSPPALVVVAAIGLAALLLQLRLRRDLTGRVRVPLWLTVVGLIFAVAAIFADVLRLTANLMQATALGAVVCFAISGIVVLHSLRKKGT